MLVLASDAPLLLATAPFPNMLLTALVFSLLPVPPLAALASANARIPVFTMFATVLPDILLPQNPINTK
jgi:hypothetical protein